MYTLPGLDFSNVDEPYLCLLQSKWGISMEQK
jgi:hypothetical protein